MVIGSLDCEDKSFDFRNVGFNVLNLSAHCIIIRMAELSLLSMLEILEISTHTISNPWLNLEQAIIYYQEKAEHMIKKCIWHEFIMSDDKVRLMGLSKPLVKKEK